VAEEGEVFSPGAAAAAATAQWGAGAEWDVLTDDHAFYEDDGGGSDEEDGEGWEELGGEAVGGSITAHPHSENFKAACLVGRRKRPVRRPG